ncbi:MAG TPA: BamA/TamA family outer membrane protein [Gammaproteobacteria bacterium]|nr:BamA/TamA family outer membrane protein [Gammaproteobacteria bacterium]
MRLSASTVWSAALFSAAFLADGAARAQDAAEPAADSAAEAVAAMPTRAELESRGTTIRAITVIVDNVFDPSNPKENKRLYRWANKIHIPTHDNVVQNLLLFDVGDRFEGRLLDETARTLRERPYLSAAVVEPRNYDPLTNSVEIEVRVRDSWTFAPEIKFSRTGGANKWGVGFADNNVFGTGKDITVKYTHDIDRDETQLGYIDSNVMGSHVGLSAWHVNASDGYRHALGVGRPFYSLDTRWSSEGSIVDLEQVDSMYDRGEVVDEFQHDVRELHFGAGVSNGVVNRRTRRWLYGVTSIEDTFRPTFDHPQPTLLPENRKLVFPWIGVQWVEDDYREMSELNDMGRTEDISLGLNLSMSIGFAKKGFGSDRDATVFRADTALGWEPGGSGRLLMLTAGGATRDENDGLHNSTAYVGARYYRRNLEKHLFSVTLQGLAGSNLDAEKQVLLGGDNGLRGYPLRYQAGTGRASLSVEERFYTDWYPWRLFRVGWAAFFDTGRVWGTDPRAQPSLGTLNDLGIGLRLTSPRGAGRSVLHIDLAFPLNGDPTIDNVQLVVESKGSF